MSDKNMILAIYDWSECLTFAIAMRSIECLLRDYYISLSTQGMYKVGGGDFFYKNEVLLDINANENMEIYGSLNKNRNIETWSSYFLYKKSSSNSTLILADSLHNLKMELIPGFIRRISDFANVGYGYAKEFTDGSRAVFEALGVTFGFPESPEEKKKAEDDSRWFEERMLINGNRKMRHLKGMFRSVCKINIINDRHLDLIIDGKSLRNILIDDRDFGELISLNNGSYIWSIPDYRVDYVKKCVSLAGGII